MTFRIEAVEQDKLKQSHFFEQKRYYKRHSRTKNEAATLVHYPKLGVGNLIATLENLPPCCEADPKAPNTFAVLNKAVGCCSSFCDCFCCVCCIKTCSKISDQCMIALTQLCSALSCFACSECCAEFCFDD
ncbi:uncharacterized protein LOC110038475 isoform X2 [Phalaenopsis equestris]|uniref:uncharacterized protein LOC110038475 isoform X2 n=1 Tax=Phalaenopsis equestris TaxID=78828 RepID=UPI0009E29CEE|nr:uncharacterized protein LOC110038475 isoform X2 [Phalaenopsis equestris]